MVVSLRQVTTIPVTRPEQSAAFRNRR